MADLRRLLRLVADWLVPRNEPARPDARLKPGPTPPRERTPRSTPPTGHEDYPGDFTGRPTISYNPIDDKQADPGEVVWTWVPYEEDHSQGKDRPVLVIGRDGPWLLVLQVTSKDHGLDRRQEASVGRYWEDIGSGGWDRAGRPSQARVNRIVRVHPDRVRRIGARLDRDTFTRVTDRVLTFY